LRNIPPKATFHSKTGRHFSEMSDHPASSFLKAR
jgi:hypothetical protein